MLHRWSQSNLFAHSLSILVCFPLTFATSDWPSPSLCVCPAIYKPLRSGGITHTYTHKHTGRRATYPTVLYKSHLNRANIRSSLVWLWFLMKRHEVWLPRENRNELYTKVLHLIATRSDYWCCKMRLFDSFYSFMWYKTVKQQHDMHLGWSVHKRMHSKRPLTTWSHLNLKYIYCICKIKSVLSRKICPSFIHLF